MTPGLALALFVLAVIFTLCSTALLRHQKYREGNGRKEANMAAKKWFRVGSSAAASVISGVLMSVVATAVSG